MWWPQYDMAPCLVHSDLDARQQSPLTGQPTLQLSVLVQGQNVCWKYTYAKQWEWLMHVSVDNKMNYI